MNILYLTDTGSIRGGGEISLLNLLENLDRNKFKAYAAVPCEGELSSRLASLGIAVFYFPYMRLSNPFNVLRAVKSIKKLCVIIRQEKIDLVHTNSTGGIVLLAGIAAEITKTPLVSHVRLIYTGFWSD